MKTTLPLLAFVISIAMVNAQSITPDGISTLAGFYSNSSTMLTFSEGTIIPEFVLSPVSAVRDEIFNSKSIVVYPNPASTSFTVEVRSQLNNGHLEIYNILGEIMRAEKINSLKLTFNCSNFAAGIYFIKVFDGDKIYTQRLIVE